jgi:hypothetical protein
MQRLSCALCIAALVSGPVPASDRDDIIAVLTRVDEHFSQFDRPAITTDCAELQSIIDDIPPHEWHGPDACAKWMDDTEAYNRKNGITSFNEVLGKPLHIDVTDAIAYTVFPATFTYIAKGDKKTLRDCRFTVVLHKVDAGWRMTSWAWSDGVVQAPVRHRQNSPFSP